jgi:hypothetical protein
MVVFISAYAVASSPTVELNNEIDVAEPRNMAQQHKSTKSSNQETCTVTESKRVHSDGRGERKLILGREYYYALLEKSSARHWAIPIAFHYDVVNDYFGDNCQTVDLGTGAFGGPIRLRDIYLFSRISEQRRIAQDLLSPYPFSDRTVVVGSAGAPNIPYGDLANDLYSTLIAPSQISFNGQQREASCIISGLFRTDLTCEGELQFEAGIQVPIKSRTHDVTLVTQGGSLWTNAFQQGGTVRTDSLQQFFKDYTGLEDFIIREVFNKQGLSYQPHQVKTGIGDLTLFGALDFAGYFDYTDGLQFGVNVVIPTGSQATGNVILEPTLTCGVYSFEPFFNAIFSTPSPVFNPTVKLVGQISLGRKSGSLANGVRVPTQVTNDADFFELVQNVPGLNFPQFYSQYHAFPFSEFDSLIPEFASPVLGACVKRGSRFLVGVGNYFYNVFDLGFRLGVFYDYAFKKRDCITVSCPAGTFDTAAATARTETNSHTLGINLTYKFRNMLELNIGTSQTIAGRNVPRNHEFFASVIAIF